MSNSECAGSARAFDHLSDFHPDSLPMTSDMVLDSESHVLSEYLARQHPQGRAIYSTIILAIIAAAVVAAVVHRSASDTRACVAVNADSGSGKS